MKKVIYIVSPTRQSTEALHWSLHKCKELESLLRIVYVSNDQEEGKVSEKYKEEIERQCRTFQVGFESVETQKVYMDACEEESQAEEVTLMVITIPKVGVLKKLFGGANLQGLQSRVHCEFKVYQS